MAKKKTATKSRSTKNKSKSKKGSGNYLASFLKFMNSSEGRKVIGLLVILIAAIMLIAFVSHFKTRFSF